MHINLSLTKTNYFKLFYLFVFISFTTHNYLNPYLKDIGFTGIEIGSFKAASAFVMLFAQPIWGLICDHLNLRTKVLSILLFVSSFTFFAVYYTTNYRIILIIIIIYSFFKSPIVPVSDSIVLNYVQGRQEKYTAIRMWGAVGLTVSVAVLGIFFEHTFPQYLFHCYLVFTLLAFLVSFKLPTWKTKTRKKLKLASFFRGDIFSKFIIFLIGVIFLETARFIFDGFFGIYMNEKFGSSLFLGIALTLGGTSEIIVYQRLTYLKKRLNPRVLLLISSSLSAVRWLLYPFANSLVAVFLIQLMHGLTFGLFYIASVTYTNQTLPEEFATTGQTLLWSIGFGLTIILGSMLGGYLLDYFGLDSLFYVASLLALFAFFIFFLFMERTRN